MAQLKHTHTHTHTHTYTHTHTKKTKTKTLYSIQPPEDWRLGWGLGEGSKRYLAAVGLTETMRESADKEANTAPPARFQTSARS